MNRREFLRGITAYTLGAYAMPAWATAATKRSLPKAESGLSPEELRAAPIEPFSEFGRFSLLYSLPGNGAFILTQISSVEGVRRTLPIPLPSLHAHTLSPDKKSLLILPGNGERAALVDLPSFKLRKILHSQPGHVFPGHAAFSGDGKILYIPEVSTQESEPGFVGVRPTASLALTARYETGAYKPHSLLVSRDNRRLTVGHYGHFLDGISTNGGVTVLDAKTGKILRRPAYPGPHNVACHLEAGDGDQVFASTRSWRIKGTESDHLVSPLLFGGDNQDTWEAHFPPELKERSRFNFSLRYAPAHKVLAVNHQFGAMVTFWHGPSKTFLAKAETQEEKPLSLELTPDGQHFLVTTLEGSLYFFRAQNGALVRKIKLPHIGWTPHLAVLPG